MTAEEIRARLREADALDPADGGPGGAEYVEAMRAILPHAEALGDPELLFSVRIAVTWALRFKPLDKGPVEFFGEALPILRRCLVMCHEEPHRFPADDVRAMWNQLFLIVEGFIWLYPQPAERIYRFLDELERHCPPTRVWTRYAIEHYRMYVDARRGDEASVERRWAVLQAQGEPEEHLHLDGKAGHEAAMWSRLGRDDRALEVLARLVSGQIPAREDREHRHILLMPYLRAGRLDEAAAAHEATHDAGGMKLGDVAAHLEFCARTGNEERGLQILRRSLRFFEKEVSSVEAMWTAATAALLCRQAIAKGLDHEWFWPCVCDDPETCDAFAVWSFADLGSLLWWDAVNFAYEMDEMDGATFLSGRIRELAGGSPLPADLPLGPSRIRTPAAPPAAHLVAGASLDSALAIERPLPRETRIQQLLQTAVAGGDAEAATRCRHALAADLAARPRSRRHRLFATVSSLVDDPPWDAVPPALDRVLTHSAVHLSQVDALLRALEPRCRPGTLDLHWLRWFRVELEARRGDADAAVAAWAAFAELPPAAEFATEANVRRRTLWWVDLRRADLALAGGGSDVVLLPLLPADEAAALHDKMWTAASGEAAVAAHLDHCARTGDLDTGVELLRRHLELFVNDRNDGECFIDRIRLYGAVARLCERLVAAGRDETWTWPADECCPPEEGWTWQRLGAECRLEAELFAERWDGLTGTTATRRLVASS